MVKPPRQRSMAAEQSFLCTFCWTPQFWPAKPKVLGREARIACESCWKGILNLSICWVCGEIVVRGEEVVSLGWCFWHRGCFGCLICGTGLDVPTKNKRKDEQLYWIDEDDSDSIDYADSGNIDKLGKGRTQRQRGVELVRIPLCSWCDNATDGLYNGQVMEIGLQNVTKKDGGLSRSRLEMQRKTKSKDTAPPRQPPRTLTKGQMHIQNNKHEHECRANLLAGAGDLEVCEDGNVDEISNYSSPTESRSPTPPQMYVSVQDPTIESSFRASKTKPLPSWMTLLPSNRQPMIEQDGVETSCPKARISVHGPKSTVAKGTPDSNTTLAPNRVVSDLNPYKEMKRVGNSVANTAIRLKGNDATTCEPAILKATEDKIADDKNSSNYRATRPQRCGTPFPFRSAVCRPPFVLFHCQEAGTSMSTQMMQANGGSFPTLSSQTATPLSRDGEHKMRDVSTEEEPIVESFKKQKIEGAILSSGEKETCKDTHQDEVRYVDERDELKMELLKLFNLRREASREQ